MKSPFSHTHPFDSFDSVNNLTIEELMLVREMDTKNPKSFMAAKLSARALETSNMKNAQVFNISYTPGESSKIKEISIFLVCYVHCISCIYNI